MADSKNHVGRGREAGDAVKGGMVILTSNDGTGVKVKKKYAIISEVLKASLDLEVDPGSKGIKIDVSTKILKYVVEYMTHHKGNEPPIVEKPLRHIKMKFNVKDPWDADFIDKVAEDSKQDLYDLIIAANYLNMNILIHLGSAKVASLIKGQPREKIKEILDPNSKSISGDNARKSVSSR